MNEIYPKFNNYSKLYFQIWYFQRQQYSLCLLFCNVIFFFPLSKVEYTFPPFNLGYIG